MANRPVCPSGHKAIRLKTVAEWVEAGKPDTGWETRDGYQVPASRLQESLDVYGDKFTSYVGRQYNPDGSPAATVTNVVTGQTTKAAPAPSSSQVPEWKQAQEQAALTVTLPSGAVVTGSPEQVHSLLLRLG